MSINTKIGNNLDLVNQKTFNKFKGKYSTKLENEDGNSLTYSYFLNQIPEVKNGTIIPYDPNKIMINNF